MNKKPQQLDQSIISCGCLQLLYMRTDDYAPRIGSTDNGSIKVYSEYLDILIVFDGTMSVSVFNQERNLSSGDVFFFTRSTYAELRVTTSSFSGARLRFVRDKVSSRVIRNRFAASMVTNGIINQKIFNHCLTFIKFINDRNTSCSAYELEIIERENRDIIDVLGMMIERQHESLNIVQQNIEKADVVVEAINLIESRLKESIKIRSLVEQLGVSHSYFVRLFKKHLGVSPNVYSRTLKVNCAMSLLGDGKESVSKVSCQLGFSDQSHFANSFREALRVTPGALAMRILC